MSVTSLALKICILPCMEGNMLGIVYWFLCSLCKGEQIWTGSYTPQKVRANLYALQGNIVVTSHRIFAILLNLNVRHVPMPDSGV